MGSLAVTIQAVDQALLTKYAGISIPTGALATTTAVSVFMEQPNIEEFPERTFPSISMKLLSITPEYSSIQDSEDDESEEVAYDDTVDPPVRSMREKPLPYRLQYSIDTWHKAIVGESRDLVSQTLIHRTRPRGSLTALNIDGVSTSMWMFWDGGVVVADEYDSDELIYHKVLNVVVIAYLALSEADAVTDAKVVTEAQVEVSLRRTWRGPSDSPTEIQVEDSKNVRDILIGVTETTEGPLP